MEEYNYVLGRDSVNLAALFYRAYVNNKMQRYEHSVNDYSRLLRLVPLNMEARLGLAYSFIRLNRNREAMEQFNILVAQHPDSAAVYVARADLSKAMKQYDAALLDLDEAIRLVPADANHYVAKAELLILNKKKKEARKMLDKATRLGVSRYALKEWYEKCR